MYESIRPFRLFFVTLILVALGGMSSAQGPQFVERSLSLGEWIDDLESGIVRVEVSRESSENSIESFWLNWLRWEDDDRSYIDDYQFGPVALCGKIRFQHIDFISWADFSEHQVDLVLRVRWLPDRPDRSSGSVNLLFVRLNKLSRKLQFFNCE